MPNTFSALKTIGALDDKYLGMMFVDYFVELLPAHILLPTLDAYFLEGVKVLYRFSLALIAGYKTAIKAGDFSTAKDFWLTVKSDAFAVTSFNGDVLIMKAIAFDEVLPTVDQFVVFEHARNQDFLSGADIKIKAYDKSRSGFQKMMKSMKISRNHIESLKNQALKFEPEEQKNIYARKQTASSNRANSITGKMMEHNASNQALSRKGSVSRQNSPFGGSSSRLQTPTVSGIFKTPETADSSLLAPSTLIASQSSFLGATKAAQLLSCLPEPYSTYQYELKYASYRNGFDLGSLYAQIERLEYCVFLFHLLPPHDNTIIGAFNVGPLSPPNQSLTRGNGQTSRIFRINDDDCIAYGWSYLKKLQESSKSMDDSDEDASENEKPSSVIYQFAVATTSSLSFGGSAAGGNAIRVDTDLLKLYTSRSETYDSPPLLVSEETPDASFHSFAIKDIEIFCGTSSKHLITP